MEDIEKVKNLYALVCSQTMTDGEQAARVVSELETLVGHQFRNTQELHYYVADFLKRKQIIHETAGRKLKRYRKKAGMTQIDLAKMLNVDRRTVIRWENDEQLPSKEALKWLETQNGISPDNVTSDDKVGQSCG